MKNEKVLRKEIANTVVLYKADFNEYALEIGIWDALANDQSGIGEIEVLVIKRRTT